MFAVNIENWIPRFLMKDRNGYAVAKAIEAGLNDLNQIVERGVDCLLDVSKMPEWHLDEMAWEYMADWYDPDADISEKRQQIAGAIEFYNRIGTAYAVKSATEAAFGAGRVEEWFEYDGSPFHFRIFADGSKMSGDGSDKLRRMVEKVKNVRSVLDQICFTGEAENAAVEFAAAAAAGMQIQASATAREV